MPRRPGGPPHPHDDRIPHAGASSDNFDFHEQMHKLLSAMLQEDDPTPRRWTNAHEWQMLVAASSHYYIRESRVKLATKYITTFTDTRYKSLQGIYKLPTTARRLKAVSDADFAVFKDTLTNNIRLWSHNAQNYEDPDYLSMVDTIVKRLSSRLYRARAQLRQTNVTQALEGATVEALGFLQPYLDVPSTIWKGTHKPDASQRHAGIKKAAENCKIAYTSDFDPKHSTYSEGLLVGAVEGTLGRICQLLGKIVEESLTLGLGRLSRVQSTPALLDLQRSWAKELDDLMEWLAWPMWRGCENGCADNVCSPS